MAYAPRILDAWRRPAAAPGSGTLAPEEIDAALREDRIEVWYQPQIRLDDGRLQGVEALARLRHPRYGLLPPAAFIKVAQDSDRILPLSLRVLEKAILQTGLWAQAGLELGVAVNLSADVAASPQLPEVIVGLAADAAVPHARITLELSAADAVDSAALRPVVARWRARGFRVALDDRGCSTETMLARLGTSLPSEVKIESARVQGAAADAPRRRALESCIALMQRLRIAAVAMGVETRADWTLLQDLGCDLAQGFFAARPLPERELPYWIESWVPAS